MHFPPNADIWHFRCQYSEIKSGLLHQINSGNYQFSPLQKIIKQNGNVIHLWGSQDVLVMMLMVIVTYAITYIRSFIVVLNTAVSLKIVATVYPEVAL